MHKAKHTWDCPCHGSHLIEGSELTDNPTTDDHQSQRKYIPWSVLFIKNT